MPYPLALPALACPFAPEVSPYAGEVDRHVIGWAQRFGLLADRAEAERFAAAKVGWLAARTGPRASRQALELLADWQMWLFVFDDRFCDESATGSDLARLSQLVTGFTRVMDVSPRREGRDGPLTLALGNVMDRLTATATGPQLFRFASAVRGYFLAQFWEAGHRAEDRPAGLAEYQVMRRHSGAVPTCMALIDVADGFELPDSEFCRPDVRAATDIAVNVTCWANDILSYPKEAARSVTVHSLPAILARERALSPAEALSAAAALHDEQVERYLQAEAPLRRQASPELSRYLDGLRSWMSGNFYWSLETGRYGIAAAA